MDEKKHIMPERKINGRAQREDQGVRNHRRCAGHESRLQGISQIPDAGVLAGFDARPSSEPSAYSSFSPFCPGHTKLDRSSPACLVLRGDTRQVFTPVLPRLAQLLRHSPRSATTCRGTIQVDTVVDFLRPKQRGLALWPRSAHLCTAGRSIQDMAPHNRAKAPCRVRSLLTHIARAATGEGSLREQCDKDVIR